MLLNQTFKNLKRIREIIKVLVKFGFQELVAKSTLRNFVSEEKRLLTGFLGDKKILSYSRWERIRMAAEELGPTFIKLAQVLSNRPDFLPEPLIKEIEKLQDNVAPFPIEEVKKIIQRELGKDIDQIFLEFNDTPLASASIAQVHRAKLISGEEVVIKVQRPGVKEVVEQDISIIYDVVRRADRYLKKQGVLNANEIVLLFDRTMGKELDFLNEGRNILKFKKAHKENKNLYIPNVYKDISSERMLVIEFIDAVKITNKKQITAWGLDVKKILANGMNIYLDMIFDKGFFHADPHPGNVLVRKDGVICLLDFGMTGKLMEADKYAFAGVFIGLAREDSKQMAISLRKLAIEHEINDMRQFEYDLDEIIEDHASLDVSEGSIADITVRLQKVMYDYRLKVPGSVFLIFRCFVILEGIGKQLHPTFKTYDAIKPYGAKIIQKKLSPEYIFKDFYEKFSYLSSLLNSFPSEIKFIMQKLRKGRLHFEIEHQGYGYLLKKLDSITNRIVIALIIGSLIIGSAITMTMEITPELKTYNGIPQISLLGLSIAGTLLTILFILVMRRRRYK